MRDHRVASSVGVSPERTLISRTEGGGTDRRRPDAAQDPPGLLGGTDGPMKSHCASEISVGRTYILGGHTTVSCSVRSFPTISQGYTVAAR